jgi:hypothetical protein
LAEQEGLEKGNALRVARTIEGIGLLNVPLMPVWNLAFSAV